MSRKTSDYTQGYVGGHRRPSELTRARIIFVPGLNPKPPPEIHRPHRVFAHPDGRTIIMGGAPQYGYTGGGLLFWDRETSPKLVLMPDVEEMLDLKSLI